MTALLRMGLGKIWLVPTFHTYHTRVEKLLCVSSYCSVGLALGMNFSVEQLMSFLHITATPAGRPSVASLWGQGTADDTETQTSRAFT
jgi:hypothetical protein